MEEFKKWDLKNKINPNEISFLELQIIWLFFFFSVQYWEESNY